MHRIQSNRTFSLPRRLRWMAGLLALLGLLAGCVSPPRMGERPLLPEVAPGRYAEIDRHALAAPTRLKRDLPQLAAYLIQPTRDDREKARAIFRWVTHNLAYDADRYFRGELPQMSPQEAVARGVTVCHGYAGVFAALAEHAGLTVVTIRGTTKGLSWMKTGRIDQITHAWNAVKLQGRWFLLDTAWGAGYLDGWEKRFVRRFQEHYFLTPPDQFIFDHFPRESRWELLSPTYSETDFLALPYLRPGFFQAGLRLVSHRQARISTRSSQVRVTLDAPENHFISARLIHDGEKLPRERVELRREGERYQVIAHLPHPGHYRLRIYAKQGRAAREFDWALDYQLDWPG